MENEAQNKHDFMLYLLEKGDAMVCLDARRPEVKVPANHRENPAMSLIFNLNFRRPMEINPQGIFATLTFQGRPCKCVIPFEAVWAIFSPSFQEGQVWEESLPRDVDVTQQMAKNSRPKIKRTPSPRTGGSGKFKPLKKVPGKPAGSKRDRSHLRVIK
ncbi:MAG: ClpXP protease specificity-enhancing factor SspB [Nitrospinales bacterium]